MSEQDGLASWVELEGCFNFRDLGGYRAEDGRRFRTGQVFRSDGLQLLTPADLEKLEKEIGLASVIDLRSHLEVSEAGRGAIAEQTTIYELPLFPEAGGGSAQPPPAFEIDRASPPP